MADAPADGVYDPTAPRAAVVDHIGGTVEVVAATPGAAGTASVTLPDGAVWEVDHADPDRLVTLDVPVARADASPLLVAAFGGDGALEVLDDAVESGTRAEDDAVGRVAGYGGGGRRSVDPARAVDAGRTGRLVLLADMATDVALGPLGRIVALAELLVLLDPTPAGDLLRPVVARLVADAAALADEAEVPDAPPLEPERAAAVLAALDALAAAATDPDPIRDLTSRLAAAMRPDPAVGHLALDAMEAAAPAAAPAPAGAALGERVGRGRVARSAVAGARAEAPRLAATWVAEAVAEVVVPHGAAGGWVRLLRPDDLVAVAQAPLIRHELRARARLLVEPGTDLAALEVQVIRPGAGVDPRGERDLVARAIRAGRAAASAERRGDLGRAADRWAACASAWGSAGDKARSVLARQRVAGLGSASMSVRLGPLLVDELDPYAAATPGL